jgi:hypothetical protein
VSTRVEAARHTLGLAAGAEYCPEPLKPTPALWTLGSEERNRRAKEDQRRQNLSNTPESWNLPSEIVCDVKNKHGGHCATARYSNLRASVFNGRAKCSYLLRRRRSGFGFRSCGLRFAFHVVPNDQAKPPCGTIDQQ